MTITIASASDWINAIVELTALAAIAFFWLALTFLFLLAFARLAGGMARLIRMFKRRA